MSGVAPGGSQSETGHILNWDTLIEQSVTYNYVVVTVAIQNSVTHYEAENKDSI